ncbi:jmjC domain-containing protein 7 [Lingula anatina]|uniref:JmjC domain-containing protein 7 n=1 Tax=Lingula anatina TaxID=7574 RepID=A0A2R2MN29_LINAN|nr:jmjC domain-containing protein 7 [Lingula anatina]|eukprot:XP_023931467.1 jmjC domain-containing protein 7 [Lingula anatina]
MPTKEEFFHEYVKRSKPVIIRGTMKDWAALSKWTTDYFKERYLHEEVHVKLTPNGDFEGVEKAELWEDHKTFTIPTDVKKQLHFPDLVVVRPATLNVNFSNFLEMLSNDKNHGKHRNYSAYLEYTSIPQYFPSLEQDIKEPGFVKGLLKRRHLNIWLSDGYTLGRLHFDPFDNLLFQLSGQKEVTLFDPHDNTNLYEAHISEALLKFNKTTKQFKRKGLLDSTSMVMSPVDIRNPDFQRFPKFAGAYPMNCTINEGEVLFMPAYWWHEVMSSPGQQDHRNLAVNFWYEPFFTKEFPCAECSLDVNPFYHHLL